MVAAKKWNVEIFISEHDRGTRAEARLRTRDTAGLTGVGWARRNTHDVDVPEIGDELAASRALADLAGRLRCVTTDDIEGLTHERVRNL